MDTLNFSGTIDWGQILKLIIAMLAFLGALIKFYQWLGTRRDKNQAIRIQQLQDEARKVAREMQEQIETQQINGLRAISRIYGIMERLTKGSRKVADRVIIFNGHNGGKMPSPGRPYYVSAIRSSLDEHIASDQRPEENYQLISIDMQYLGVLLDCIERDTVEIITETLPKSILADYHKSEDIHHSIFFKLGFIGTTFVYGSVSVRERQFSDGELVDVRRMVNMMQSYFAQSIGPPEDSTIV